MSKAFKDFLETKRKFRSAQYDLPIREKLLITERLQERSLEFKRVRAVAVASRR